MLFTDIKILNQYLQDGVARNQLAHLPKHGTLDSLRSGQFALPGDRRLAASRLCSFHAPVGYRPAVAQLAFFFMLVGMPIVYQCCANIQAANDVSLGIRPSMTATGTAICNGQTLNDGKRNGLCCRP